jgi:hypothetical protein
MSDTSVLNERINANRSCHVRRIIFGGQSAPHAQSECNARQILQPGNCIGDDLDALERELAKQINDYRLQNGLPAIPLSPALSLVADRHVKFSDTVRLLRVRYALGGLFCNRLISAHFLQWTLSPVPGFR